MIERTPHQADSSDAAVEPSADEWRDPVIELYKKDVDRTLLRENLKLTVEQRLLKAQRIHGSIAGWREAGRRRAGR